MLPFASSMLNFWMIDGVPKICDTLLIVPILSSSIAVMDAISSRDLSEMCRPHRKSNTYDLADCFSGTMTNPPSSINWKLSWDLHRNNLAKALKNVFKPPQSLYLLSSKLPLLNISEYAET
jgi:hypothetical protein